MESWKQYLISIIVSALSCGIISQMISDTKSKELMHLLCGLILAISILHPLSRLDLKTLFSISISDSNMTDQYITEGKEIASEAKAARIKAYCEAYILEKAKAEGADIEVDLFLDENQMPASAEIEGTLEADIQSRLQNILVEDLGIPKENQTWSWNQESNSS